MARSNASDDALRVGLFAHGPAKQPLKAQRRAENGRLLSIAQQNRRGLGGRISVLHRQRRDHLRLAGYLGELADTDEAEQGPILLAIYRLVFPHAFAEEAVLWPVIRRVLPDGHELTLQVEREHQAINELVTRLEELTPGSAERRAVLNRVAELLGQDVRDEEDELLPRLQAKLSPLQLKLLGLAWEAVRRIAPTRAHPIVSRRPPGNVLSALPLSLLDRSRDRVDARQFRQHGLSPDLSRASQALLRVAHAVEQLPGFKAGEDLDTRVARGSGLRVGPLALAAAAAASGAYLLMARRRAM